MHLKILYVFMICLLPGWSAEPEDLPPLFELGLAGGVLTVPTYRGSDRSQVIPVAAPYFYYRGDVFEADDDGMRSLLFTRGRFSLGIDGGLAIDDDERGDLPDLAPVFFEIGPAIDMVVMEEDTGGRSIDAKLGYRFATTFENDPDVEVKGRGPSLWLSLDVADESFGGNPDLSVGLSLSAGWASRRQHAYYYSVAESDASDRYPAYTAESGYTGATVNTYMGLRLGERYRLGGFLGVDLLSGAEFDDSPLVEQTVNFQGGLFLAWRFFTSKRRATAARYR